MLIVLIIVFVSGDLLVIERPSFTGPQCQALGEQAVGAGAADYRCVERFDV